MPGDVSAQLLISVTRRLFISLIVLFGLSLIAVASLAESIYIVPLLVFASGLIGGFVGLQRRLKDLTFVAGFSEHFVTDVISRFEGAAVRSLPLARREESSRIEHRDRKE